jgi:DNA-nicking Smr family endonuclease
MDFGDILDEWERQNAKTHGKRKNFPKTRDDPLEESGSGVKRSEKAPKTDPLTAWLRINGVEDKDAGAPDEELHRGERRRRLLRKRPDGMIDLHGLSQDEAWESLELFFADSRRRGFEKVLIIHGKGNHSSGEGILKRVVKQFIDACPWAGESGDSAVEAGGSGATWVLLK